MINGQPPCKVQQASDATMNYWKHVVLYFMNKEEDIPWLTCKKSLLGGHGKACHTVNKNKQINKLIKYLSQWKAQAVIIKCWGNCPSFLFFLNSLLTLALPAKCTHSIYLITFHKSALEKVAFWWSPCNLACSLEYQTSHWFSSYPWAW